MKFVVFMMAVVLSSSLAFAKGGGHVSGYTTRSGTRVAPYHRTNPNRTRVDNYSHKGNVNPYTGKRGYKK